MIGRDRRTGRATKGKAVTAMQDEAGRDKSGRNEAGRNEAGRNEIAFDAPTTWGRVRSCRHGLFLYNRNDVYIGRSLELYGEYSDLETELLRSLLREGDWFVEAGANIGALTVPLARKVGPGGAGFVFEPQRLNHQMLCANLALNGLTHVQARQAGLGAEQGVMSAALVNPDREDNYGDVRLRPASVEWGEQVTVSTLDAVGLPQCRLIKMDVQGMERQVLEGARATIARCRPALWVENDDRETSPDLIRLIRGMGYRLWWHKSPLFSPRNFRGAVENVFEDVVSLNMLCLPAEGRLDIDWPEILADDEWPMRT